MIEALTKVCDRIDAFCRYLLIGLTVEITLVIAANVFARYLFEAPAHWAEEVTRFSFAWMTFIGAACAYKRRQLVAMSIVSQRLPAAMKWWVSLAVELVMAAFLIAGLVWGTILLKAANSQTSAALGVPMTYVYICLPLSCLFMLLFNLTQVLTMLKTRQLLPGWGEDWS